jgi:hypothetical protein
MLNQYISGYQRIFLELHVHKEHYIQLSARIEPFLCAANIPGSTKKGLLMNKTPVPETILCNGTTIPYTIHYSDRRRTLAIEISPDLTVKVRAPQRATRASVRDFIEKKSAWIAKHISRFGEIRPYTAPKKFTSGERFLYLGQEYHLAVHACADQPHVRIIRDQIDVGLPATLPPDEYSRAARSALIAWYHDHAIARIEEYVAKYAQVLAIPVPPFTVKVLRKRWGSCSAKNRLNFNQNIVMAPARQIEYVVVHELCHFRHKNHSARFWNHVRSVMPDYRERRVALRKEGWKYGLE